MFSKLFHRRAKSATEVLRNSLTKIEKSNYNNGKPFLIQVLVGEKDSMSILSTHSIKSFDKSYKQQDLGFVLFIWYYKTDNNYQHSLNVFESSKVFTKFKRYNHSENIAFLYNAGKNVNEVIETIEVLIQEVFDPCLKLNVYFKMQCS